MAVEMGNVEATNLHTVEAKRKAEWVEPGAGGGERLGRQEG